MSRTTITVGHVPGLENAGAFSSVVTSLTGAPLVVERTMFWDDTSLRLARRGAPSRGRARASCSVKARRASSSTFLLLANSNADAGRRRRCRSCRRAALPVTREFTLPARVAHQHLGRRRSRSSPTARSRSPSTRSCRSSPSARCISATDAARSKAATIRRASRCRRTSGSSPKAPRAAFFDTFFLLGNAVSAQRERHDEVSARRAAAR